MQFLLKDVGGHWLIGRCLGTPHLWKATGQWSPIQPTSCRTRERSCSVRNLVICYL